jgi:hypothetical protein
MPNAKDTDIPLDTATQNTPPWAALRNEAFSFILSGVPRGPRPSTNSENKHFLQEQFDEPKWLVAE